MILNKIIEQKIKRVAESKSRSDISAIRSAAADYRETTQHFRLSAALARPDRINIIAEIKRASPSKGIINDGISVERQAADYTTGGACAISVLTEEDFFSGSLADLVAAREATKLPLLRKDFIIDKFQIYEAAAAGADAILLITAALSEAELLDFKLIAEEELGIDALVEVHTEKEFETAMRLGANLIGVNNRDLHTFNVSLEISRQLIAKKTPDLLMISESGISEQSEVKELRTLGFDGFLIGETLMRSFDAATTLQEFAL